MPGVVPALVGRLYTRAALVVQRGLGLGEPHVQRCRGPLGAGGRFLSSGAGVVDPRALASRPSQFLSLDFRVTLPQGRVRVSLRVCGESGSQPFSS